MQQLNCCIKKIGQLTSAPGSKIEILVHEKYNVSTIVIKASIFVQILCEQAGYGFAELYK